MQDKPLHIIQRKLGLPFSNKFNPETARALMWKYQLSPIEASHFLGQFLHETGGFRFFEEDLRYTAKRLAEVFPHRYAVNPKAAIEERIPNERALKIHLKPREIANDTYGGRMGNRLGTDDGWNFRGRGKPHLTGRNNYTDFAKWMNDPRILETPDIVACEYSIDAGHYFFEKNRIYQLCTDLSLATIGAVTRNINGGTNGLQDRIRQTKIIASWLQAN